MTQSGNFWICPRTYHGKSWVFKFATSKGIDCNLPFLSMAPWATYTPLYLYYWVWSSRSITSSFKTRWRIEVTMKESLHFLWNIIGSATVLNRFNTFIGVKILWISDFWIQKVSFFPPDSEPISSNLAWRKYSRIWIIPTAVTTQVCVMMLCQKRKQMLLKHFISKLWE